jgi:hypothetical protein
VECESQSPLKKIQSSTEKEKLNWSSLTLRTSSWVSQYAPANPALGKLRQEDCKFKASLGYLRRLHLKKQINNKNF